MDTNQQRGVGNQKADALRTELWKVSLEWMSNKMLEETVDIVFQFRFHSCQKTNESLD